ncbi:MAG: UbiA-like polyprenyltransferase [Bacteroidota bacterium]
MPSVRDFFSLVKFSHTIFALPFALLGFTLGTIDRGRFDPLVLLLVLGCMVFARSAAMAFNRYLDRDIDKLNPRTAVRDIPAGRISANSALVFVLINCALFILCTAFINQLVLALSPVALLVILGYSYTKRFTPLCHFVLGLGLSLAPVGAYLAVTASWAWLPVLYGAVVLIWVSGFDIVYALQDEEFDRGQSLQSIPTALGRDGALRLGRSLHLLCALLLTTTLWWQMTNQYPNRSGWLTFLAGTVFIALLFRQHTLVKANDLSRIDLAFFTTNGLASLLFGALLILDLLLH